MGGGMGDLATEIESRPIMVMLVDDQPFVAEMLQRQLGKASDINFHYCQDPSLAVQTADKIGPTVLLVDYTMPGVDGLTLCRFFRDHAPTRDIPIVMLSSNDDPATKAAAFEAGANDYLVKLPDSLELVARLRYHSSSYISKLQRDDAYRALRASQMKLMELNMKLEKLATLDGMTGLFNRRHFDERLADEWLRAMRNRHPLSLIMFDVDLFKLYNDRYGHLEGDECLKRVADVARKVVSRPADIVARYGGEEFVVLLPETDLGGARTVAERLRGTVEELGIANPDSNVAPHLTISLGVTTVHPAAISDVDCCVKKADQALYEAKNAGRNRVAVALPAEP